MVVAHPDDEDSGMLTYETRGHGARAMMLTLNRGEGGQNLMSDDFEDALGLVRTQELLSADRYSNVQQFFGSVVDFGFSKTREEALMQWGHDRVLADAVRVIRMTRPLVVASVFVGGPSDGHGHHSVAGQMAQEAFAAAGDPNMFPEQIQAGLRPWLPMKMYARAPLFPISDKGMLDTATGKWHPVRFYDFIQKKWTEGPLSADIAIPEGNFDSILGETYLQIARDGLALQKSQNGGGRLPQPAPVDVSYHRFSSLIPMAEKEQSYFDGVDVSLAGIASLAPGQQSGFLKDGLSAINALVERAQTEFSIEHPEKIAPLLAQGLKQTNDLVAKISTSGLPEQTKYDVAYELKIKQDQFQQAIIQALGVSFQATAAPLKEAPGRGGFFNQGPAETFAYAVPGQEFAVRIHIDNPGASSLAVSRIWLETPAEEKWTVTPEAPVPGSIAAAQTLDQRFIVRIPDDAAATRPYFTRPNDEQPYYDIVNPRYQNLPFAPYPLASHAVFTYEGVEVHTGQVVQTVRQQMGIGMTLNPLMITPAVSVRIIPQAGIVPLGSKSFTLSTLLRTESENGAKGSVQLNLPAGWRSDPPMAAFDVERAGQEQRVQFEVFPDRLEQKPYTITAVADSAGHKYQEGFVTVGYPTLRPYNDYTPAAYKTSGVDVKMASSLRIGYVMGTGDSVPQSLENIGVKVEFLSPQDLAQGNLQKYDEILLGVRAYAARPELATNHARLLDYVKNGGVLVVQYNTQEYDHNYGPYPYNVTNESEHTVTDETSHVEFVDPKSPVLTWPNQITENDFNGWVEERGHGFLKSWDSQYKTPLETHDPDQDPQQGGLVYTPYGRGLYVYVAFALYRQLPDGVPGAYRIFANLLSLPRNQALRPPVAVKKAVPQLAHP
jgi:LmbE family N-acetylglucosaminyl deacetylase